nr:hypothetical protein [Tanacetum cinerariifolium]
HGLRVVCTGSNRDKLAMLRNSKDQAFFGASMVPFPTLDRNYIDWLCEHIDLPTPLDPAEVFELFKESGYRPEMLGAAADAIRFDFFIDPENVRERFAELVRAQADELNANLKKQPGSLSLQGLGLCDQAFKGELLCVGHLDGRGFSLDGPFAIQNVADALVRHTDPLGDPRRCLSYLRNQLVGIFGRRVIAFCVGCHVTSGEGLGALHLRGMPHSVPTTGRCRDPLDRWSPWTLSQLEHHASSPILPTTLTTYAEGLMNIKQKLTWGFAAIACVPVLVRPWYKAAIAAPGTTVRTGAYYWAPDDVSLIGTVHTVADASGAVVGVVGLDVSLKQLTELVKNIKLGHSGYLMLVEANGNVLVDPSDAKHNFKPLADLGTNYAELAKGGDGSTQIEIDGK